MQSPRRRAASCGALSLLWLLFLILALTLDSIEAKPRNNKNKQRDRNPYLYPHHQPQHPLPFRPLAYGPTPFARPFYQPVVIAPAFPPPAAFQPPVAMVAPPAQPPQPPQQPPQQSPQQQPQAPQAEPQKRVKRTKAKQRPPAIINNMQHNPTVIQNFGNHIGPYAPMNLSPLSPNSPLAQPAPTAAGDQVSPVLNPPAANGQVDPVLNPPAAAPVPATAAIAPAAPLDEPLADKVRRLVDEAQDKLNEVTRLLNENNRQQPPPQPEEPLHPVSDLPQNPVDVAPTAEPEDSGLPAREEQRPPEAPAESNAGPIMNHAGSHLPVDALNPKVLLPKVPEQAQDPLVDQLPAHESTPDQAPVSPEGHLNDSAESVNLPGNEHSPPSSPRVDEQVPEAGSLENCDDEIHPENKNNLIDKLSIGAAKSRRRPCKSLAPNNDPNHNLAPAQLPVDPLASDPHSAQHDPVVDHPGHGPTGTNNQNPGYMNPDQVHPSVGHSPANSQVISPQTSANPAASMAPDANHNQPGNNFSPTINLNNQFNPVINNEGARSKSHSRSGFPYNNPQVDGHPTDAQAPPQGSLLDKAASLLPFANNHGPEELPHNSDHTNPHLNPSTNDHSIHEPNFYEPSSHEHHHDPSETIRNPVDPLVHPETSDRHSNHAPTALPENNHIDHPASVLEPTSNHLPAPTDHQSITHPHDESHLSGYHAESHPHATQEPSHLNPAASIHPEASSDHLVHPPEVSHLTPSQIPPEPLDSLVAPSIPDVLEGTGSNYENLDNHPEASDHGSRPPGSVHDHVSPQPSNHPGEVPSVHPSLPVDQSQHSNLPSAAAPSSISHPNGSVMPAPTGSHQDLNPLPENSIGSHHESPVSRGSHSSVIPPQSIAPSANYPEPGISFAPAGHSNQSPAPTSNMIPLPTVSNVQPAPSSQSSVSPPHSIAPSAGHPEPQQSFAPSSQVNPLPAFNPAPSSHSSVTPPQSIAPSANYPEPGISFAPAGHSDHLPAPTASTGHEDHSNHSPISSNYQPQPSASHNSVIQPPTPSIAPAVSSPIIPQASVPQIPSGLIDPLASALNNRPQSSGHIPVISPAQSILPSPTGSNHLPQASFAPSANQQTINPAPSNHPSGQVVTPTGSYASPSSPSGLHQPNSQQQPNQMAPNQSQPPLVPGQLNPSGSLPMNGNGHQPSASNFVAPSQQQPSFGYHNPSMNPNPSHQRQPQGVNPNGQYPLPNPTFNAPSHGGSGYGGHNIQPPASTRPTFHYPPVNNQAPTFAGPPRRPSSAASASASATSGPRGSSSAAAFASTSNSNGPTRGATSAGAHHSESHYDEEDDEGYEGDDDHDDGDYEGAAPMPAPNLIGGQAPISAARRRHRVREKIKDLSLRGVDKASRGARKLKRNKLLNGAIQKTKHHVGPHALSGLDQLQSTLDLVQLRPSSSSRNLASAPGAQFEADPLRPLKDRRLRDRGEQLELSRVVPDMVGSLPNVPHMQSAATSTSSFSESSGGKLRGAGHFVKNHLSKKRRRSEVSDSHHRHFLPTRH